MTAKEILSSNEGQYCYLVWFIGSGCVIRSDIPSATTIFNLLDKEYGNNLGNVEKISETQFEWYKYRSFPCGECLYSITGGDLLDYPSILDFFDPFSRFYKRFLKIFKK